MKNVVEELEDKIDEIFLQTRKQRGKETEIMRKKEK